MNVLVHVDEIFLKGKNQSFFVNKLADNIRRLFKGAAMRRVGGGFVLESIRNEDMAQLANIPGIATFAPVVETKKDLGSIKDALDNLNIDSGFKTFRITASRSDKKYKMTSSQIEKEAGAYVEKTKKLKVDLKHYEAEIRIDISKDRALVYTKMSHGAGGLPTGSAGKILCLISGGIDSPVAAYELMKRGANISLIHFINDTPQNIAVENKITDLALRLSLYQPVINLYIAPFAAVQREIIKTVPSPFRMIVSRRLMFKIAARIAKKTGAMAIATGDSLGQVASQTLENISAIYQSVDILKLAPLIGRNKSEITKIAEKIGTLEISKRPFADCCSLIAARHPETRAIVGKVLNYEKMVGDKVLDKISLISYHISIHSIKRTNSLKNYAQGDRI